jgi:hypothetical protein
LGSFGIFRLPEKIIKVEKKSHCCPLILGTLKDLDAQKFCEVMVPNNGQASYQG